MEFEFPSGVPWAHRITRIGVGTLVFATAAVWMAAAQGQALTEADAVRLGLDRGSLRDVLVGSTAAAEAEVAAAGLWPNPTLSYERDRVNTDAGRSVEEKWTLSQSVDFSGRRSLRADAAGQRLEAARAGARGRAVEMVGEVRRTFYDNLFLQRRIKAFQAWLDRLSQAETVVSRLARAGESSGYDRRRLSRERVTAEARFAAAQAELERAREKLAAMIGRPPGLPLEGELLPPPPLPLQDVLARLEQQPQMQSLAAHAAALEMERVAAERGWIPEVTLGAGPKRVSEPFATDDGIVIAVSIPLPVFDHGQEASRRLAAEALAARGELGLARARSRGEARGLWQQTQHLREAAVQFRAQSVEASHELARVAEAAYRAGEGGVLDLLDAYRTLMEAQAEALGMELTARLSGIELDRVIGEIPQ